MADKSTVLLLGGTGKVASNITPLLEENGYSTVIATRKGTAPPGYIGYKFDCLDSASYAAPFGKAPDIVSVFLVGPTVLDPSELLKSFVDFAVTKGVKRFVLLSDSVFEAGGPVMEQVHQHLIDRKLEFCYHAAHVFMGEVLLVIPAT